jgi:hypothetical protein
MAWRRVSVMGASDGLICRMVCGERRSIVEAVMASARPTSSRRWLGSRRPRCSRRQHAAESAGGWLGHGGIVILPFLNQWFVGSRLKIECSRAIIVD